MRCMSTQWVLGHMPKKSALRLIRKAKYLVEEFSVGMKAAVSMSDFRNGSPLILLSQGLTQKSLRRLFPCDTSMVVIIDDRADVWEWSPNLVKVIPCINSVVLF